MFVLRRLGLASAGFLVGCSVTWSMQESAISQIREFLGYKPFKEPDYLETVSMAQGLALEERRREFVKELKEKGPSLQLSMLISDFNAKAFHIRAEKDIEALSRREELDLLEALLRKQYPQLFSSDSGKDFVAALSLKLYCEDHYRVPKFLRPTR